MATIDPLAPDAMIYYRTRVQNGQRQGDDSQLYERNKHKIIKGVKKKKALFESVRIANPHRHGSVIKKKKEMTGGVDDSSMYVL